MTENLKGEGEQKTESLAEQKYKEFLSAEEGVRKMSEELSIAWEMMTNFPNDEDAKNRFGELKGKMDKAMETWGKVSDEWWRAVEEKLI